jgi:hypothetical protein
MCLWTWLSSKTLEMRIIEGIHRKCFLQTSHKHIEHHLREKLIEEELLEDEKNKNLQCSNVVEKMFIGSASTISDSLCYKMFHLLLMK